MPTISLAIRRWFPVGQVKYFFIHALHSLDIKTSPCLRWIRWPVPSVWGLVFVNARENRESMIVIYSPRCHLVWGVQRLGQQYLYNCMTLYGSLCSWHILIGIEKSHRLHVYCVSWQQQAEMEQKSRDVFCARLLYIIDGGRPAPEYSRENVARFLRYRSNFDLPTSRIMFSIPKSVSDHFYDRYSVIHKNYPDWNPMPLRVFPMFPLAIFSLSRSSM